MYQHILRGESESVPKCYWIQK